MMRKVTSSFERFSILYLWAILIVVFSIWTPSLFPTSATVHTIASSQAVTAILALAVIVPLACGAFDLSVGANVNLAAVLVVTLQTTHGMNIAEAVVISVLVSTAVGAVNGLLVVRFGISSFIATLGVATVLAAVQTIVTDNAQPLAPVSAAWNNLTQSTVAGFQVVVVYMLILALILWWVMSFTPVGRFMYAIGGNVEAARLSGINTGRYVWLSLIFSGFLTGVGGVLYASLSGPSLTFGQSLLLPAYAAAFLGSTQFRPGRFNVWGCLVAVYMLATGVQGLQYITGVSWLGDMFNGLALIVAVGFAAWRQRSIRQARREHSGSEAQGLIDDNSGAPPADSALITTNRSDA